MAEVVLGIASSHSPQMTVPSSEWAVMRQKDENDKRIDYPGLLKRVKRNLEADLAPECWKARYDACQQGIAKVGEVLREAKPDVVVCFGDDQHEQFLDDNMPAVSIFHGASFPVLHKHREGGPSWMKVEEHNWAQTKPEYQANADLALHLINSLVDQEFDVARTNRLRSEVGIGHAFSFLYRRVWPGSDVPLVPVMVNTYYPPNQPTPKRCYKLGQAVRRAVESWPGSARVALFASGGLSHVIVDEDVDQQAVEGMTANKPELLWALPRERLIGGTSEILNWVALAGAMEAESMTLVDYVTTYRSLAGTGVGAAFAYWN